MERLSRIHKELLQCNNKRKITQFSKRAGNVKRHFFKEDTQMAKEQMKRCWMSLVIREVQIKTTRKHHTPLESKRQTTSVGEDVGKWERSYTAGANGTGTASHFGK